MAQGMNCPEVARLLGDSVRTVQYWVHRFEDEGLSGLVQGDRPGRPAQLGTAQMRELGAVLHKAPNAVGIETDLWDGKTLAAHIERRWKMAMSVRQCQRLLRLLGFRLRKPRLLIAGADPERQAGVYKNPVIWASARRLIFGR